MAKIGDIQKALEAFDSGGGGFFFLKNDKDTAKVRFLHGGTDDLDIYTVHQITANGKKRWTSCLADDFDGDCPFCKAGNAPKLKMILQVADLKDNSKKIWERGKTMIPKILGLIKRNGPLNQYAYEIERNGKAGDPKTRYELYPDLDSKGVPEDLIEKDTLLDRNGFIIELSYDEALATVKNNFILAQSNTIETTTTEVNGSPTVDPSEVF